MGAIAGGGEAGDSYIGTDRLPCLGKWAFRHVVAGQDQIPLVALALDLDRLYPALHVEAIFALEPRVAGSLPLAHSPEEAGERLVEAA